MRLFLLFSLFWNLSALAAGDELHCLYNTDDGAPILAIHFQDRFDASVSAKRLETLTFDSYPQRDQALIDCENFLNDYAIVMHSESLNGDALVYVEEFLGSDKKVASKKDLICKNSFPFPAVTEIAKRVAARLHTKYPNAK